MEKISDMRFNSNVNFISPVEKYYNKKAFCLAVELWNIHEGSVWKLCAFCLEISSQIPWCVV
jgi:hypothetical protein